MNSLCLVLTLESYPQASSYTVSTYCPERAPTAYQQTVELNACSDNRFIDAKVPTILEDDLSSSRHNYVNVDQEETRYSI